MISKHNKDSFNIIDNFCSNYHVKVEEKKNNSFYIINIVTPNKKICQISFVLSQKYTINPDIWIGENIIFEGSSCSKEANNIDNIEEILLSVSKGMVTEKVWYRNKKIVKSCGFITISTNIIKTSYSSLFSFINNDFIKLTYKPWQKIKSGK
ncbi:hypothetical protein [Bathymodiolus thermophilus thioautotrophic gill symbiont]|uniref:Uncharacterized protein n=1 Tax=Bathymodiolus thermophilus thioautotrophic gill symbiont TaxID=2360 RepID=A0A1J5UIL4_9GAMM|nr:hypothetical protein [Bathymodiolus thermophilus thioautotrophic gill symbiont]OIR24111.1 hypothetical protein BGC33_02635 [Bathymodiolus thermophilus thioautotrophic gill symbiont]